LTGGPVTVPPAPLRASDSTALRELDALIEAQFGARTGLDAEEAWTAGGIVAQLRAGLSDYPAAEKALGAYTDGTLSDGLVAAVLQDNPLRSFFQGYAEVSRYPPLLYQGYADGQTRFKMFSSAGEALPARAGEVPDTMGLNQQWLRRNGRELFYQPAPE
jgi:hypothetical protein